MRTSDEMAKAKEKYRGIAKEYETRIVKAFGEVKELYAVSSNVILLGVESNLN